MKRAFAGLLIVLTFVIAGAVTEIKTPHNVAPEECKKIPLKVDDTISQCEKIWFVHCILAVILVFGAIVVHNMRNRPDTIRIGQTTQDQIWANVLFLFDDHWSRCIYLRDNGLVSTQHHHRQHERLQSYDLPARGQQKSLSAHFYKRTAVEECCLCQE